MGRFICRKPMMLSGRCFTYGEEIPDGLILPTRALALMRSGYIAEAKESVQGNASAENSPFQPVKRSISYHLPLTTEKGVLDVEMEPHSMVTALTIMQKNVEDAAKDIALLEDMDALIILNAADSRKGIQKAAEERASQLQPDAGADSIQEGADSDGEEEDGDA